MEQKDYWKFMLHVSQEMRMPLHSVCGFLDVLKDDEHRGELAEDEREDLFKRLDKCLADQVHLLDSVVDLSYYSNVDHVNRKDKVLVNQVCEDLVKEQDVKVLFNSDIPNFYSIFTNEMCLRKVLGILLYNANKRVSTRKYKVREACIYLTVTERCDKGKLTFAVSDTGDPTTQEDDVSTFYLPVDQHGSPFLKRVEYYNCWLMVRLLGGFIYIDPSYRDGRRVIFDISIKQ